MATRAGDIKNCL